MGARVLLGLPFEHLCFNGTQYNGPNHCGCIVSKATSVKIHQRGMNPLRAGRQDLVKRVVEATGAGNKDWSEAKPLADLGANAHSNNQAG